MATQNRGYFLVVLLASLALGACKATYYEVVLTPEDGGLKRTITRPFGPEELERTAALYGEAPGAEVLVGFEDYAVVESSFSGTFSGRMPEDLDNSGYFLHCESPFGSASVYSERFGGHADLAGMLADRKLAYDRSWTLIILALESLVGDEPGFASVRNFLDTEVRHDLWNLALTASLTNIVADTLTNGVDNKPDFEISLAIRLGHALDAQGYFDPLEIRSIENLLMGADDDDISAVVDVIGGALGRKMGLPDEDPLPASLSALKQYSLGDINDMVERFLDDSDVVANTVAGWRNEDGGTDTAILSDDEYLETMFEQSVLFDLSFFTLSSSYVSVELNLPIDPWETNGARTDEGVVRWKHRKASLLKTDGHLPNIVHAFWAEPDADYQVARFGSVVVEDSDLDELCAWRKNLSDQHRQEWDAFVSGLQPGPELVSNLKGFLLSGESHDAQAAERGAPQSQISADIIGTIIGNL